MVLPKVEDIENLLLLCSDQWGSFLKNLLLFHLDVRSDVVFREMNRHGSVILEFHHRDADKLVGWILLLELGLQVLY